jgi:hypothetical protein
VVGREQLRRTLRLGGSENNFNHDSVLRCGFRKGRSGAR